MSQRQETKIDRLVSVIQEIQLGRGTGSLIAMRGTGGTQEKGTIMFVNGRMTEASVGQRNGVDAFNWLSTWRNCLFTFSGTSTQRSAMIAPTKVPTIAPKVPTPAPYKTLQTDVALQVLGKIGFSRAHRHLLLLIDGQRSVADLERLMGRDQHEFHALLQDLERALVIRIPANQTQT